LRDSLVFLLSSPSPERIDIGFGESPLVEEHTGWAGRCYNSCVIWGGIVVMPGSNESALLDRGAGKETTKLARSWRP
jgi:hypothetical protein